MNGDQNRSGKITPKSFCQKNESFDPARRCTDGENVAIAHGISPDAAAKKDKWSARRCGSAAKARRKWPAGLR
jgi:hypothetical protein